MTKKNNTYRNFTTDFQPMKFSDLVGQDDVVDMLKGWIINKEIPTAILFSGGIGAGKTSVAKILARAAACLSRKSGEYEPCNKCSICRGQLLMGIHYEIGSRVKADKFMDTVRRFKMSGTNANWISDKTGEWYPILVDEMHELSKQTMYDLRREFEGDWANSFFIGTTSDPQKIDPALLDRCVEIAIHPPSKSALKEWVLSICDKTDIAIKDKQSAGMIVDKGESRFRQMLRMLQMLRDMGLSLQEDDIRKVAKMMGVK